jgi:hypothetical protein
MSDFEKIELDPHMSEARFERSEFAQVIFLNIAETYPTDAHVECRFTLTPNLTPTTRDWIGLYKVGWSSQREYVFFMWAPLPERYIPGTEQDFENRVLFQAHQLPKDDGEFYQFCYVTGAGHVRGASTPFQFKQPSADDFVEIEDDDSDMMVIKSRTIALEEDLHKACLEKEHLKQRLTHLDDEHESLVTKLVELERQLQEETKEKDRALAELGEAQECIEGLRREAHEMSVLQESLRDKMTTINQEKESILKRLEENECYLNSLQEKIKSLISEKDALMGRNKTLEQEKELFKNHFTSSEGTIQGYLKEVETLKKWLSEQEEVVSNQSTQITKLTSELQQERKNYQRQICVSKTDKAHIDDLVEKLRNAEDKLSAAEHCKKLLNEEVTAVQQAHHKMSCDLEKSKTEAHSLEIRVAKLEAARQEDKSQFSAKIDQLQTELNERNKLKETVEQELLSLTEKLSSTEEKMEVDQGSLFALQKAQTHLKERYAKIKFENSDKQKQLEELLQKQKLWNQTEKDLRNEIRDLKERLNMGAEEYKIKYMECRKLNSELRKVQKTLRRSPDKKSMDDKSMETEKVKIEKLQMSVDKGTETYSSGEEKEVDTQTENGSTVADLTSGELQAQLEELGRELSSRRAKKQRYKALYVEEREKKAFLQRHYHEELGHRDEQIKQHEEEIAKLKTQLADCQEDSSQKIKQLQITIDKQRKQLNDLQAKEGAQMDDVPDGEFQDPVGELDPLVTDCDAAPALSPPLTPLPPPIQPEVLPSAKVAKVKATMSEGMTGSAVYGACGILDDLGPTEVVVEPSGASAPSAPSAPPPPPESVDGEDDRFHDADGDPQKLCPVCYTTFPLDLPQHKFEEHVEEHYGKTCPMCSQHFDTGCSQTVFESHVQSHFTGEAVDRVPNPLPRRY